MSGNRAKRSPGWAAMVATGLACLRSLVPAGFMLAPVAGKIAFVLCEPGIMAGMPGMAGGHPHHHVHHGPSLDCPYAQSAGPAPLPSIPLGPGTVPVQQFVSLPAITQTTFTSGPPRRQTSRGPPLVV